MNATYRGSYWQPGSRIISRNSESISTTVASIHDRLLPVNLSFIPLSFPLSVSLSLFSSAALSIGKKGNAARRVVGFSQEEAPNRRTSAAEPLLWIDRRYAEVSAQVLNPCGFVFLRRENRGWLSLAIRQRCRDGKGREREEKRGGKIGNKKKKKKERKEKKRRIKADMVYRPPGPVSPTEVKLEE